MILHFLRHAQAESFNKRTHQHDRDRLLTDEGRCQIQAAARGLLKSGIHFDGVISSPYLRAAETAKIVSGTFHFEKEIVFSDNLTPDALYHKFRKEFLASHSALRSVLIVTHQPFVSHCISILLAKKDDPLLSINMGTGTLCSLDIDARWSGAAILLAMIPAEQAALMGHSR